MGLKVVRHAPVNMGVADYDARRNPMSPTRHMPLRPGHDLSRPLYSCERNHRPPAHSLVATLDPLLPVPVMAELLEYCRKETMGEETSFAHSCAVLYCSHFSVVSEPDDDRSAPSVRDSPGISPRCGHMANLFGAQVLFHCRTELQRLKCGPFRQ